MLYSQKPFKVSSITDEKTDLIKTYNKPYPRNTLLPICVHLSFKYLRSLGHIFSVCILSPGYSYVPSELYRSLKNRALSSLICPIYHNCPLEIDQLFPFFHFPILDQPYIPLLVCAIHFSGFSSDFTSFSRLSLNSQDWVRCPFFVLLHISPSPIHTYSFPPLLLLSYCGMLCISTQNFWKEDIMSNYFLYSMITCYCYSMIHSLKGTPKSLEDLDYFGCCHSSFSYVGFWWLLPCSYKNTFLEYT